MNLDELRRDLEKLPEAMNRRTPVVVLCDTKIGIVRAQISDLRFDGKDVVIELESRHLW